MVAAPEPRLLTVQPFDKGLTKAIEKAIRDSDLGLNPATQGNLIRVPLPALSEERRKELVKVVHKLAEEGRVAVRHARTDAIAKIKKLEHVSEDDKTPGGEGRPEAHRRAHQADRRPDPRQRSGDHGSLTDERRPAPAASGCTAPSRPTSPSSWTGTAAGPRAARCRGRWGTRPG